ncbi:MAG: glycosyltransferase family 2 protein [Gammaproteobacteria bacterium]
MNTQLAAARGADQYQRILQAVILIALLLATYATFSGGTLRHLLVRVQTEHWAQIIVQPSLLWAMMGFALLGFRTLLWLRYRPFASVDPAAAPMLTVIIPAYNEGPMVEKAIDSVASARYPHGCLEIFVVDDGSRDDTWEYIQRAALRQPELITAVRFAQNQGKRAALAAGFRRARGAVVVTIDSDSVIEPDTLLAIVGPFRDPKVGAVAGRVAVYNRFQGLIPRMLRVRFSLAFDFLRATESMYRTVYCCPGALAGYRTAVVRKVLGWWENQTFLGAVCSFGEDRALTNCILEEGYDTVYQRSAVVHTIVPLTYTRLCKMFLRWDRSYVREELRLARIVWKRPLGPRLIAIVDKTITNLRYPVSYATLGLIIALSVHEPTAILHLLAAVGMMSMLYMLYYLRMERSWDFVFGVLYAYYALFSMFWIFPYALVTVRARSWLTR